MSLDIVTQFDAKQKDPQYQDDRRRIRRCRIDLTNWYMFNPDGPPPHPSDEAYTNPLTHRPPSDFIRRLTMFPQFHDISSGYRARESFARLVLPVYAAAIEAKDEDTFLDNVVLKWLDFFPEDLLPSNNKSYQFEGARLTVSDMPVSIQKYTADLHKRCTLRSLPDSPERLAEAEALFQATLLQWKAAGARKLNRIHASFDEELPRIFFLDLLKEAIQKCLNRGISTCTLSAIPAATEWKVDLETLFMHWFYHQRMPLSFQILYAPLPAYTPFCRDMLDVPDDFFWRPPYMPRHPSILGTSDSECATTARHSSDTSEVARHLSTLSASSNESEDSNSEEPGE